MPNKKEVTSLCTLWFGDFWRYDNRQMILYRTQIFILFAPHACVLGQEVVPILNIWKMQLPVFTFEVSLLFFVNSVSCSIWQEIPRRHLCTLITFLVFCNSIYTWSSESFPSSPNSSSLAFRPSFALFWNIQGFTMEQYMYKHTRLNVPKVTAFLY